ncbi:MAG: DUF423 domain-containing protein [Deltaproteobacteria bacterium]|nr:DUF423 domain-containing protein [Deltaproteobacteria bacterium]
MKTWISIGSFIMASGITLGAFGAHGLKDRLSEYQLDIWEKAVFYQLIHGLAILAICLLSRTEFLSLSSGNKLSAAFLFGILFFSGSLYALALTNIKWLGAITPIGGLAFIIGWIVLCVLSFKQA